MRNLLINNTVYVSGRTSLCRGGKKRWRLRVKDGDGDGGEEGGGGGVTQFSRELIEHDSNKNKMLGPSAWAVTGSVEQNFSVTLQGSDTIFDFSFSFFFFWQLEFEASALLGSARLGSALLCSAPLCGLTPSFNLLHNVPPHWQGGEKKHNCCFRLCTSALCIFEGHALGLLLFFSTYSRPVCNPASVLLLPGPPLALNNTSRHAVRDQLTLKLLDFTLKASVPQMSAELCRQFCLSMLRPCLRARGGVEVNVAWVMVHMSIQLLNFGVFFSLCKWKTRELENTQTHKCSGAVFGGAFWKEDEAKQQQRQRGAGSSPGYQLFANFFQTKHHPLKSVCAGD